MKAQNRPHPTVRPLGALGVTATTLCLGLLAAGCPEVLPAAINLTVTADPDVTGVSTLEVVVRNATSTDRATFNSSGGDYAFPVIESLNPELSGAVTVFVVGLQNGAQVASGSTMTSLPGGTVSVTVHLSLGLTASPCGDCDALSVPESCIHGECNLANGSCNSALSPDGFPCDDGTSCTTGELCTGGTCGGGTGTDCSMLDDTCNVGTCDDFAGCVVAPPARRNAVRRRARLHRKRELFQRHLFRRHHRGLFRTGHAPMRRR